MRNDHIKANLFYTKRGLNKLSKTCLLELYFDVILTLSESHTYEKVATYSLYKEEIKKEIFNRIG